MNYRPLLDCLTIKQSEIEGLGLFATEDIPAGTNLGESHVSIDEEMIRTPLGGFYNHSNEPNTLRRRSDYNSYACADGEFELEILYDSLFTIKDIKSGDEITVKYSLYNPEDGREQNNEEA